MLDMLLCIIPKIEPDAPTVGPAVLKSHLKEAGFSCEIVDFNIWLYRELEKLGTHRYYYYENDSLFSAEIGKDVSDEFRKFADDHSYIFDAWLDYIRLKSPRYVGLSLLTVFSVAVAIKLAELIRDNLPEVKIVWGGGALIYTGHFHYDETKRKGLMHHFVFGDGEKSIVDLMKGNLSAKGIDSTLPNQIENMDSMLLPDYDDIDWSQYHSDDDHENMVYITGSRGCVKRCNFCNVYEIWPEYRYRSAGHILNEMIQMRERYGRRVFKFTDSLINGSMKTFRSLMQQLSDYNNTHEKKIEWISQWIIRPKTQFGDDDFRLMKESGCIGLDIGLESFSQDIRFHMGKKFTDEDMWWCFEMLNKYEIYHTILMIVGYPTETDDHHQQTLSCIRKLFENGHATKKIANGSNLIFFSFGNTMMMDESMPIWDQVKDGLIEHKSAIDWNYMGNTLEVRVSRMKEILDLIANLSNNTRNVGWMTQKSMNDYEKRLDGTNNRLWFE